MVFKIDNVIPWGRSLPEYIRMFALTPDDLQLKILDCASGPASFNAEMTRSGYMVISCDPIYQFSALKSPSGLSRLTKQLLMALGQRKTSTFGRRSSHQIN